MKKLVHIERKWQSDVTAYVCETHSDGSTRYYIAGRYGGGGLTAQQYEQAVAYRPGAWKRYWYEGREVVKVDILKTHGNLTVPEASDCDPMLRSQG
jgi:hypothetical protein